MGKFCTVVVVVPVVVEYFNRYQNTLNLTEFQNNFAGFFFPMFHFVPDIYIRAL